VKSGFESITFESVNEVLHLEALREPFGELDKSAVVDGIGAAIEKADATERGVGARGMPEEGDRTAGREGPLQRNFGEPVDVASAGEVLAANTEVAERHRVIPSKPDSRD
jgi:hypothetical protein